jgi:peptide-methionine (S)-S-oxide reductase
MNQAMFGAGCFWGVEAAFAALPGVQATAVGYAGGKTENPTYKEVCSDRTGHAEVVQLTYDPAIISYATLVEKFFQLHDPSQLNRQGPDVGSQYRSAIFTYSQEQAVDAVLIRDRLAASGQFKRPIVTQIEPAPAFWRAEDYHQQYFAKRGGGSCHI